VSSQIFIGEPSRVHLVFSLLLDTYSELLFTSNYYWIISTPSVFAMYLIGYTPNFTSKTGYLFCMKLSLDENY